MATLACFSIQDLMIPLGIIAILAFVITLALIKVFR